MKTNEAVIKAMKYSWILLGAIGTIAGIFALLTTPITMPIKILLIVGGEAIIACFLMIPYWLQKSRNIELDNYVKTLDKYLGEERQKVERYKQRFGELPKEG